MCFYDAHAYIYSSTCFAEFLKDVCKVSFVMLNLLCFFKTNFKTATNVKLFLSRFKSFFLNTKRPINNQDGLKIIFSFCEARTYSKRIHVIKNRAFKCKNHFITKTLNSTEYNEF